ncbi:MAG: hypothetical protein GW748_05175 [Alphaproteobacteria bacterium]|nr:hypothetical protein [Alphaproteobacteria bacterium]NCQ67118.1 hypothetical protein [Alphaproteobacteria bacterium]NCT07715.1 hypothetical protein [Alphaproteobacteria bacterium]
METDLTDAMRKFDRNTTIFQNKVDETIQLKKELEALKTSLQDEISELNGCRKNVEDTIRETTKSSHPELVVLMTTSLSKHFSKLSETVDGLMQELKSSHQKQEKKMKKASLYICLAFCFGSLLSGTILWYFFPQQVNYSLSQRHFEYLREGILFRHAFKKLSPQEQKNLKGKMGEYWKEYYEEIMQN